MSNQKGCEGSRYSPNPFLLALAFALPAVLNACSPQQTTDISFQLAHCGDGNTSNDSGGQIFTSLPKGRTLSAQDGTHLTVVGPGKVNVDPSNDGKIRMEVRDNGANMLTLQSNLLIINLLATMNADGTTNLAVQEQCATPDTPKSSPSSRRFSPQNSTALWVGRQSRRRI